VKKLLGRPKYAEDGDVVKLAFYLPAEKPDEIAILDLIESKNETTIAKITKKLNISRNTATRRINDLIKANKIIRLGKGPATKFRIL